GRVVYSSPPAQGWVGWLLPPCFLSLGPGHREAQAEISKARNGTDSRYRSTPPARSSLCGPRNARHSRLLTQELKPIKDAAKADSFSLVSKCYYSFGIPLSPAPRQMRCAMREHLADVVLHTQPHAFQIDAD